MKLCVYRVGIDVCVCLSCLFAHPLGFSGRLCSMIAVVPEELQYYFRIKTNKHRIQQLLKI